MTVSVVRVREDMKGYHSLSLETYSPKYIVPVVRCSFETTRLQLNYDLHPVVDYKNETDNEHRTI